MLRVKDIIKLLEEKFPTSLAYDWDNVGLQIGDIMGEVKKIMVALDVTTPVVDEAIRKGVDLIIAHHPFIFSPLKSIDLKTPQGKNIQKLLKNDITVYTIHTNYDVAPGGMNDVLAKAIGLENVLPFAMIDDVHGLGRVGKLKQSIEVSELIQLMQKTFALNGMNYTTGDHLVETVAVIGGSGGKYIHEARAVGADVLITGDITYHTAIDAKEIGLILLDIGHYAEIMMQDAVCDLLKAAFEKVDIGKSSAKNPISTYIFKS